MVELAARCRVCMEPGATWSLYAERDAEYLPNVIYNISGVKILRKEVPEAKICPECADGVVAALKLIIRCQETEELLASSRLQPEDLTDAISKCNTAGATGAPCRRPLNKGRVRQKDTVKLSAIYAVVEGRDTISKATYAPRFDCNMCGFVTRTGKLLVAHKEEAHGITDPLIYACEHCAERFSWKPTLFRHIERVHRILPDDKRFACNQCAKAYTQKSHLKEHKQQVHEKLRFKCAAPDCNRVFARVFTLRRHFSSAHTSKQRYHCTDCDKYFKIYDLWNYHNRIVHKNETVYCPRCGYPFRHKEKLEEHLERAVCKRSVIPCQYCQRRFTTKAGLKEHLRNIHHIS